MKSSRISYNIHAQSVPDTPLLLKHLAKISPVAVLVLDGLGLVLQIKDTLPNTLVIHRNYGVTNGDNDVHKRVSPEKWMELRAKESEGGRIWLYTTNEPAFDKECINWHIELMHLALKQQTPLVIGNWPVGNPGADDWGLADELLRLASAHPDLFVIGLHEYYAAVPTSGFYGGYPDNAGAQPNLNAAPGTIGQNLVPDSKWPKDTSGITLFHCGRFRFMVNYCLKHGIKPPRIIVTEHGMDDVSDIKPFLQKITPDAPFQNVRSWKSIKTWLQQTFPQWSPERAYYEGVKYLDDHVYKGSAVEAQLIYAWCGYQSEWYPFSVAQAGTFQQFMEQSVNGIDTTEAPKVTLPPPAPTTAPITPLDPPQKPIADKVPQTDTDTPLELVNDPPKPKLYQLILTLPPELTGLVRYFDQIKFEVREVQI